MLAGFFSLPGRKMCNKLSLRRTLVPQQIIKKYKQKFKGEIPQSFQILTLLNNVSNVPVSDTTGDATYIPFSTK
jgi:hypothetical protein